MKLSKEERVAFASAYLRTLDAGRAADEIGRTDGAALLCETEISKEIARLREGAALTEADVLRRMGEIAFGRANDCVKLALEKDCDIASLDLTLLSELRRTDKAIEVKLVDRFAALQYLGEHVKKSVDPAAEFFAALADSEDE